MKNICTLCIENRDFIGFSRFTGNSLNIQNGGLHWLNGCQNFDFQIVQISYFIFDFDHVCDTLKGFIRACMPDSIAFNVVVPFKIRGKVRAVLISVRIGFFSDYCCRNIRSLRYGQSLLELIIDQSVRLSQNRIGKIDEKFQLHLTPVPRTKAVEMVMSKDL